MKTLKLFLGISLLAMMTAGCGIGKMVKNYPNVSVKLENEDLENKGGKVDYTVKGTVPPKYLKKKATLELEVPYLVYDAKSGESVVKSIDKITLAGEKSKSAGIKIPYKAGGSFSKSGTFDFQEDYLNTDIDAVGTIAMGKKAQKMEPRKLGEGISNTSSLVNLYPTLSEADYDGKISGNGTFLINAMHQYREEFIEKTAVIYFEVNLWNVNWNLKLNKDQAAKDQIKTFVDFLFQGPVIEKVIIYGWASPEGEESKNQGLSEKRFEEGKKWFNQQFDKYLDDYAKKNKIKRKDLVKPELVFENNAKGEDWSGFEKAVEKSNIKEKNQILNVVRSQPTSMQREQKIREMTDIYNEIKDAILPPLRRSEVILRVNKNNYNDEQIKSLVTSDPAKLTLNERLYAATLTQDPAKKEAIYSAIIDDDKFQKDWRAYNNLAILKLTQFLEKRNVSLLDEAMTYLNKAEATSPNNGIVLNNTALAHYLKGNLENAKNKFQESQKASLYPVNQNYNLGMYEILGGDYAKAKSMMTNKHCDYNMALAQLVDKDYSGAKSTLDCIEKQDAKVCYLKAVLGARMKNQAEVYQNLKSAIQKDATLAAKAAKDPEFKKFRTQSEFKEIIK